MANRCLTKDERQALSIKYWHESKGLGTLNLTMRFGKTRIAKIIATKVNTKLPFSKIIVITPNDITRKNAQQGMVVNINTHVFTITSYSNQIKKDPSFLQCDLLIADEIHKLLSSKSYSLLSQIESRFKLGLTGSKLSSNEKAKLKDLSMPVIDVITEEEALRNNWIAKYIEYNIPVELDDTDKLKYAKMSEIIHEALGIFKGSSNILNIHFGVKVFDSDFSVAISAYTGKKYTNPATGRSIFIKPTDIRDAYAKCMGWSKNLDMSYEYNQQLDTYYNPNNLYEKSKLFKSYIKKRNDILILNLPKINKAIEIINKFKDLPCICFNESTEMADILQNHFSETSLAYHSNIESKYVIDPETGEYFKHANGNPILMGKTRLKKLAIEGIKLGIYKQLFTAKALNEGVTIDNIELVITTGGDTNISTHAQRRARGLTIDYANPNKTCIVVNIYVDDFYIDDVKIISRDKSKLQTRQQYSGVTPIWINDVREIQR